MLVKVFSTGICQRLVADLGVVERWGCSATTATSRNTNRELLVADLCAVRGKAWDLLWRVRTICAGLSAMNRFKFNFRKHKKNYLVTERVAYDGVVDEGHEKQWSPEQNIRGRDHQEHFHSLHPVPFHSS